MIIPHDSPIAPVSLRVVGVGNPAIVIQLVVSIQIITGVGNHRPDLCGWYIDEHRRPPIALTGQ